MYLQSVMLHLQCDIVPPGVTGVSHISLPFTTDEPNILRGYERMSPGELESIGIGSDIGINWGEALHSALMPMTPAMSLSSLSDGEMVTMVAQNG